MVVRIIAKNGMQLGNIYRTGIKMGPYTFHTIDDHKKFILNVYGNIDTDIRVMYGNIDFMSYAHANDIGDVLYKIQTVNSRNIDIEIMKALRNLTEYQTCDISRRLIKIANDIVE